MPSIKYSYVFDEEIERVYECFRNSQLNKDVAYYDFVSKLKFHKGENFDQENSEFSFFWKNYYYIQMVTESVTILPHYRMFTIKSTSIDKICLKITVIFEFFKDSVDNKTIFIFEIKYEDEFFTDLIKNEVKSEDLDHICLNVEKHLNYIIKGLEINNSILINFPFEVVWDVISSPKKFFEITNEDLTIVNEEDDIIMNPILKVYEKVENKLNPIVKFITESIYITTNYAKVTLISIEKLVIPNQKMIFSLIKLDNEKSFFSFTIKFTEPVKHQVYLSVKKAWKKKINIFFKYLESLKKKV